jgi:anaerobic dimethyl sulfoxide reductase subunit A
VGAAATANLVACAPSSDTAGQGEDVPATQVDYEVLEGGEWKCASCWLACGGSCVNKVYVKDGMVLQQKTDDLGTDSFDFVQQRACARGRSLRHLVFGADRIKYPMKRKNWQPGGGDNVNGELRGTDEWVRISWEEALELIGTETKRIVDAYGSKSIYCPCRDRSRSFAAYGGYAEKWGGRSDGGSRWPAPLMLGDYDNAPPSLTLPDRYEYYNSKLIVLWGHNPTWSCQCNAIRNFQAAKAAGARFIAVDPVFHDSAKVLDAEFVPVRPSEDVPLLLAIAYEMITNDLQDQEFLDTYCLGFDADHMPEGADPQGSFKDYVLGTYDGVPKTPEWATEFCGTPVEMIRSLATAMATEKPMALTASRAPARVSNGSEWTQAFLTIGLMTGNLGKPGACVGYVSSSNQGSGNGGVKLVGSGSNGVPGIDNPVSPYSGDIDSLDATTDYYAVCHSDQWRSVLNKKIRRGIQGETDLDIRMIAHMNRSDNFNDNPDILTGIKAHRAVDFVLSCPIVMDTRSLYADIILPVATPWERGDVSVLSKFNREVVLANEKIVEPLFETRSDPQIERGIGEALGLDPDLIFPLSEEQQFFNILAGSWVLAADGETKEPLFTITAEDVPEGIECEPQEGRITIGQFYEDGLYRVERSRGDNYGFIPYKDYLDDPVANPLQTSTGKIEIYCQALADVTTAYGYTVKEPIAKYGHFEEGWMDTYSDWDSKVKGDYPLLGLSLHGYRTVHSTWDNVPQLREAFPNLLRINPADAAERNVGDGDVVLISSRWGRTLRRVTLTERVMKGVVMMDECMLANIDPETDLDDAGCFNVLCGPLMSDCGVQAWNSTNVQFEIWDGDFVDDCLRPQRIVEV